MDWDRLRVFLAVARAGSFSRAVEILNITQSAISRQVAALEAALKTPLFIRHSRGLELTNQGVLLLETVSEVFDTLERVQQQLVQDTQEAKGFLKIATTISLGSFWLAPYLSEFVKSYPDIQLSVLTQDYDVDLSKREADVSIRPCMPQQPDLIQRHLCTLTMHLYASPEYLREHGEPHRPENLDFHRLICFGDQGNEPYPHMNWFLNAGAEKPRVPYLTINSALGMKLAAENGIGIVSLFAETQPDQHKRLVKILPEMVGPKLDVYYVYPERLRGSKKIAVFGDFLVRRIAGRKI